QTIAPIDMIDGFLWILVLATVLRGLGAGIILETQLMTLPLRRRFDLQSYARFMRAYYAQAGVKIYAAITMTGFVLSIALASWTFASSGSASLKWSLLGSVAASCLGFVGTAGAYPTMKKLWATHDSSSGSEVSRFLDRFASWGVFSAVWHVV